MFTERRKADRTAMAKAVAAIAHEKGIAATITSEGDPSNYLGDRAVFVTLEGPRGLGLTIDFDGNSCQPDTHVLSWYIGTKHDTRFATGFAPSINTIHRHKATDIAEGFEELCALLQCRLDAVANGSAFEGEQP